MVRRKITAPSSKKLVAESPHGFELNHSFGGCDA